MKWTSKPSFVTQKIFENGLIAIHKIETTETLSKPAYVGMCILELRKKASYEFHYNYIKKQIWQEVKMIIHRHKCIYNF